MSSGTAVAAVVPSSEPKVTTERVRKAPQRRASRWIVAVVGIVGLLITALFGHAVATKPGVYWSDAKVLLLAPQSTLNPNPLVIQSDDLASLAGTIAKMVNPGAPHAHVNSPTITLANQGIRNGWSVSLPNFGGQFTIDYSESLLDVQAVGPTAAGVAARMQTTVDAINAKLTALQDADNVTSANRITTSLSPSTFQIYYSSGSRARAVGTTLALGLVLTIVAMRISRSWFSLTRGVRRRLALVRRRDTRSAG